MHRMIRTAGLALLTLVALSPPASAQTDVAGVWTLVVQGPQGPAEIVATLDQDGQTVTGTLEVPMVEGAELTEGMIDESTLSFLMTISVGGQVMTLTVEGQVDGSAMEGSMVLAEFGNLPFTASRADE